MLNQCIYSGVKPFNKPLPIEKPPITPELILDAVCKITGVSKESITGEERKRKLVDARSIVVGLAYKFDKAMQLKTLCFLLNRHHATIIYQRERFDYDYRMLPEFRDTVDAILNKLA